MNSKNAWNHIFNLQLPLGCLILALQFQTHNMQHHLLLELDQVPPAYPYPDPYYRSIFAPSDAQSFPPQQAYNAQPMLMEIQPAGVLLPSDTVEEPVFVNAKQCHGIMRCWQIRKKAELENKVAKSRKPYLHESRHLHV